MLGVALEWVRFGDFDRAWETWEKVFVEPSFNVVGEELSEMRFVWVIEDWRMDGLEDKRGGLRGEGESVDVAIIRP